MWSRVNHCAVRIWLFVIWKSSTGFSNKQNLNNSFKSRKEWKRFLQYQPIKINSSGSKISGLYNLPKVGNAGLPGRPVLNKTGSQYNSTAKWISYILELIRRFEFIDVVYGATVSKEMVISLGVNLLFTNVSLTETLYFIYKQIDTNGADIGTSIVYSKEITLWCTVNVQYSPNDEFDDR